MQTPEIFLTSNETDDEWIAITATATSEMPTTLATLANGSFDNNRILLAQLEAAFNNGSNDDDSNNGVTDYGLPLLMQLLVVFLYVTVIITAVAGNVMVIYIILAFKRLRTATNMFIINLSLADLLMALTCIPFHSLSTLILLDWPFGALMCNIVNFTNFLTVLVSAYTLLAISVDRYSAIVHPLRRMSYNLSRTRAAAIVCAIWLFSCIIPLPTAMFNTLRYNNATDTASCYEEWPGEDPERDEYSPWRWRFEISVIILQYFLPAVMIAYNYGRICYTLWFDRAPPGEADTLRDQMLAKQKRKLTKMMLVVVTFFIVAWLPLNTFNLAMYFIPDKMQQLPKLNYIWFVCHWLAMSSACHNPIIYGYMNSKFRTGYKYCLYSVFCCQNKLPYHQIELHLLGKRNTMRSMVAECASNNNNIDNRNNNVGRARLAALQERNRRQQQQQKTAVNVGPLSLLPQMMNSPLVVAKDQKSRFYNKNGVAVAENNRKKGVAALISSYYDIDGGNGSIHGTTRHFSLLDSNNNNNVVPGDHHHHNMALSELKRNKHVRLSLHDDDGDDDELNVDDDEVTPPSSTITPTPCGSGGGGVGGVFGAVGGAHVANPSASSSSSQQFKVFDHDRHRRRLGRQSSNSSEDDNDDGIDSSAEGRESKRRLLSGSGVSGTNSIFAVTHAAALSGARQDEQRNLNEKKT